MPPGSLVCLLPSAILPAFNVQGTPARIIVVSSSAHQMDGLDLDDLHFKNRKYTSWKAYGQSKLCNILFTNELAHRYFASIAAAYCCQAAFLLCCFATRLRYSHVTRQAGTTTGRHRSTVW